MTSTPAQRTVRDISPAHPEVEFALVLARTIDSVRSDPQQLRSAVYELARQKLQQLAHEDPNEKQRLLQALEAAIEGVEAHTRNHPVEKFAVPPARALPAFLEAAGAARRIEGPSSIDAEDAFIPTLDRAEPVELLRRPKWSSSAPLRYVAMLGFFGLIAAVVLLQQRGVSLAAARAMIAGTLAPAPAETQKPAVIAAVPAPAAAAPPAPKRPLPTAYGVYAESGGRLYELQMIQGRAPDPRIAISAAITRPSETALPDGHLRFIVFRREGSSGASDPIDVRLIARVTQQTTFDATGKPVVSQGDDTWVIRNISIPFRAAPLSEDPQMFEVQPRDDAPLSPGRYALILKAQAYDFTVEGAVTDKRHCLQRLAAANGVFYSECEKP
ncbi:hypothetical protein [Bradyrhizobium septentrionale]|uniref:Uncharacterized protein n=1 Tax=Bradyrhizobium septentrionale TaxID=1404411 RepID=A0ABZ2NSC5_9BRAD|nr:hypothetical protein [Bradyrhizobium septentrionale]UGY13146.1 hypothetical protein HAP48_0031720 [Bradyrhizobium septentrionale]UGY21767.1 hypothetical protein HU675_0027540 [Bradyrhizobium septentrionale]